MIVSLTPEQMALYAARYHALRQMFKNNEANLELWGSTFKSEPYVYGEDNLDDFLDLALQPKYPATTKENKS